MSSSWSLTECTAVGWGAWSNYPRWRENRLCRLLIYVQESAVDRSGGGRSTDSQLIPVLEFLNIYMARKWAGTGSSYRPARLNSLAELFLGIDSWALLKIKNSGSEPVFVSRLKSAGINSIDSQPGRIVFSESISGLLKVYKYGLWIFQLKTT
jgi:hypothetical protein